MTANDGQIISKVLISVRRALSTLQRVRALFSKCYAKIFSLCKFSSFMCKRLYLFYFRTATLFQKLLISIIISVRFIFLGIMAYYHRN